jgi:hypothetical protein
VPLLRGHGLKLSGRHDPVLIHLRPPPTGCPARLQAVRRGYRLSGAATGCPARLPAVRRGYRSPATSQPTPAPAPGHGHPDRHRHSGHHCPVRAALPRTDCTTRPHTDDTDTDTDDTATPTTATPRHTGVLTGHASGLKGGGIRAGRQDPRHYQRRHHGADPGRGHRRFAGQPPDGSPPPAEWRPLHLVSVTRVPTRPNACERRLPPPGRCPEPWSGSRLPEGTSDGGPLPRSPGAGSSGGPEPGQSPDMIFTRVAALSSGRWLSTASREKTSWYRSVSSRLSR